MLLEQNPTFWAKYSYYLAPDLVGKLKSMVSMTASTLLAVITGVGWGWGGITWQLGQEGAGALMAREEHTELWGASLILDSLPLEEPISTS